MTLSVNVSGDKYSTVCVTVACNVIIRWTRHKTKNIHAQHTKINFDQHRGHIRALISSCNADTARFMVKPIPKDSVIGTSKREFEPSLDTILPLLLFVVPRI